MNYLLLLFIVGVYAEFTCRYFDQKNAICGDFSSFTALPVNYSRKNHFENLLILSKIEDPKNFISMSFKNVFSIVYDNQTCLYLYNIFSDSQILSKCQFFYDLNPQIAKYPAIDSDLCNKSHNTNLYYIFFTVLLLPCLYALFGLKKRRRRLKCESCESSFLFSKRVYHHL